MNAEEFIQMIGPTAREVCLAYNLPASVCIAQAIIESGWGKSLAGAYNYFGRKAVSSDEQEPHATQEYINGHYVDTVAGFKSYASLKDAVEDWCILIREEKVYRPAVETWDATWNLTEFVNVLAQIYATDPEYAGKVLDTIAANNLTVYDHPE